MLANALDGQLDHLGRDFQAAIDRARQAQDSAAANITSLAASVDAAKDRLSYTYLKAPFDGNVVRIYVENFQDVTARQPVMRIVDDSRVEFVINIPESLISYVPDVTDVRVTFDPFPGREIPAAVKEIGTEASDSTRTYPVTLIMDQPDAFKKLDLGYLQGPLRTDLDLLRGDRSGPF